LISPALHGFLPRFAAAFAAAVLLMVMAAPTAAGPRALPGLRLAASTTPNFGILTGDKPYVPLFTQVSGCDPGSPPLDLAGPGLDAMLAQLARWYVHLHGESSNTFPMGAGCQASLPSTLASLLAARGLIVSNYRNGSYTSQSNLQQPLNFGEAADIEANASLAIGTFWPGDYSQSTTSDASPAGRLLAGVDSLRTTLWVAGTASVAPSGSAPTWPYVNSRGTGAAGVAHSTDTYNFVSWVRVDDEIMQVAADPVLSSGQVKLMVRRGIFGTTPAPHLATARVLSPVYVGAADAVATDVGLDGSPNRADPSFPLRYEIKFATPAGYGWIARRIGTTFGAGLQGYNAVWLDVSSCWPYDLGAADHQSVTPWDDGHATHVTQAQWELDQKTKLGGLHAALPGIKFMANNLAEYGPLTCNDDLMANAYDGGVLENWAQSGWPTTMAQTFRNMQNNWPAIYWARWDNVPPAGAAAYRRFAYGSMLLAYRSSATRMQYGGPWGYGQPDPMYFWNLGVPSGSPASLADVTVAGAPSLYQRDFANARVVVNAGTAPATEDLGATYYDLVHPDVFGNPTPVTSITLGADDAAFLLRASAGSGVYAPAAWFSSPTWYQSLSLGTLTFSGNTGSRTGVAGVEVAVQQTATGLWWHPDGSWGSFTSYPAALATPGGTRSTWTFTWPLALPGAYTVSARAYDTAGYAQAAPSTQPFTCIDTRAPTTNIASPADGSTLAMTAVTESGTASDDIGVASVAVSVENLANGTWLQADGGWGPPAANPATIATPGSQATWTYRWVPPATGEFAVQATSTDTAGNADQGAPTAVYWIDGTAPTVTITAPAAGLTLPVGLPILFTGQAQDDAPIKAVTVGIKSGATGRWLQPDGTWGAAFGALPATLSAPGAAATGWAFLWTPTAAGSYQFSVGATDLVNLASPRLNQPVKAA
jgi:hypothetical protein